MKHINLLLTLGISIIVAGCASSNAGDVYSRDETRQVQDVQMGVVEGARPIKIEGTQTILGSGIGTVVGSIAGSSAGQGKGSAVGAILGAVIGGVTGAAIEEGATREDGMEISVKLDSGRVISVVQAGKEEFKPGDKVRILQANGETRIAH